MYSFFSSTVYELHLSSLTKISSLKKYNFKIGIVWKYNRIWAISYHLKIYDGFTVLYYCIKSNRLSSCIVIPVITFKGSFSITSLSFSLSSYCSLVGFLTFEQKSSHRVSDQKSIYICSLWLQATVDSSRYTGSDVQDHSEWGAL